MRHLLYVTLGFTFVCALKAYRVSAILFAVCTAVFLLFCALTGRKAKPVKRAALAFLGCALGFLWFSGYTGGYIAPAAMLDGKTRTATIRAADYSRTTGWGMVLEGTMEIAGRPYQVRAYLDMGDSIAPGTSISGMFRFRLTAPGGEAESLYQQSKGIFLLAYQADEMEITVKPPGKQDIPALIRQKIKGILQSCFPEDTHPFAKGLLIGDTSDLSYKTDTDFKISGIRHIVAVSGLHVSILFAMVSNVALRKRWVTALLGFPALLVFAAVAGFTPSVSRACIMSGLMLLAMLAGKEYDGPTALAFAVLVLLTVNPLSITSVSLQLSALSAAGIMLFAPGIRKWLGSLFGETKGRPGKGFLVKWVSSSVSVTLSAMTLTTPLCAYYFGTVSLVGVVTNLLTLWVIGFIFYGIMGVCLLSFCWMEGAVFLAGAVSIPIRYVLRVAQILADVPLAAVYTQSPYIAAWLVFVYVLLGFFWISTNRRPVTLGCCAVLGLCLALIAGWQESREEDFRFTVLDVGQGQCLLLQSQGKHYMIDCGGDSDTVVADLAAETLLSQGISRLDGLILTHLDRDHAGAAVNFLSRVDTDLLILPAVRTELADYTAGQVVYAEKNLEIGFGDTRITIYAPTFPGNSNEMSLCLLLDTKKCDILVTGDRSAFGERSLLRNADIPQVDILIAGHHGSKNSTCEELLTAVCPETVCISAGADNSYGHPAQELLRRLYQYGCTVYRTDWHGTITIRR